MEVPIELCKSAKVYRKDPIRRTILALVLVALYAFAIPYCYMTAGEPRKAAMIHSQKLADEQWALEASAMDVSQLLNGTSEDDSADSLSGFESMESVEMDITGGLVGMNGLTGSAAVKSSLSSSSLDAFDEEEEEEVVRFDGGNQKKEGFSVGGYISSFFSVSKETKRAKAEFEKWQKEYKEKSGVTVSLPPEYLPSAWACLALFATLTFHALFYLLGHWIVSFKASTMFTPASKVEEGCYVLITPPPNRGSPSMVPVQIAGAGVAGGRAGGRSAAAVGAGGGAAAAAAAALPLQVEFQRQKYNYQPASKLGDAAKKFPNGVFSLSAYPTNYPLEHYLSATGHKSDAEVDKLTAQWGKNHLAVAIPSFLELLQLQLLSPLGKR
jgi:hypothetical protein